MNRLIKLCLLPAVMLVASFAASPSTAQAGYGYGYGYGYQNHYYTPVYRSYYYPTYHYHTPVYNYGHWCY